MLYYGQKFLLRENNMALYGCLRITFLCLAGIFFLLTLFLATWQKKWKRLGFDIFVCLIQMPLWIILGIAILRFFPDLSLFVFSRYMDDYRGCVVDDTALHHDCNGYPEKRPV